MPIYVTGDTHGSIDIQKLTYKRFPESKSLTRDDILIICGDFGLPFLDSDIKEGKNDAVSRSHRSEYQNAIKWLSEKPYTILFVDGNHDNHPFWNSQPVITKYGGKMHKHIHADNVFHLLRGEIYEIDVKRFFSFGGAKSHDMWCREENFNWWKTELASEEEKQRAISNLEKVNYKIDYVISHTPPASIAKMFYRGNDSVAVFLDSIHQRVFDNIKCWFAGHIHEDIYIPSQKVCLVFESVINLKDDLREIYNKT